VPKSCPDCGAAVEFAEQEARLLTGTCAGCGKMVTVVTGVHLEPGTAEGSLEGTASETTAPAGPACAECGGPLAIEIDGRRLTASCDSCDATTEFFQGGADERPAPRERSFDGPRRGRGEDGMRGANARPCRQCGAPLRFTTSEDGVLTGECDSCGNRFTLPPRRDSGRGGGFGGPGRRGPPGRYPPRRDYRSGGDRRPSRPGGSRYRPRDRDDSDDGEDRPRRRPRRD